MESFTEWTKRTRIDIDVNVSIVPSEMKDKLTITAGVHVLVKTGNSNTKKEWVITNCSKTCSKQRMISMSDSTNRKIGPAISMANMGISLVIGLIYTPLLIRFLGNSEYGIYTLAMSLISYLSILDLGFGNALVRYTARNRAQGKEEKNLIGMFLLFYSAIAVAVVIIGIIMSQNMENFFATSFTGTEAETLRLIFNILLINTVIAFPASVFSSVIRSHERFIFSNLINLLQNLINHGIMIWFLLIGFKSVALAWVSLISTAFVAIINFYYCMVKLKVKIGFEKFDSAFYKEIFVYSAFIFVNIIVDQLYASTDKIILGKVCGSVAVAVYGVGVTFQQYYTQFSTAVSGVFLPYITKLSMQKNAIQEMSAVFLRIGRIQLMLLSLIVVGFAVYGQNFVQLWAGSEYMEAYYIALLIMVPSLIPLSQNIGISILQALNKHKIRSVMYLCIAILNVGLSIPLAVKYGGIGAAIGTAVGNILGQILFMNWFYWKRIGIDIPTYWRSLVSLIVRLIPVAILFSVTLFIPVTGGWFGLLLRIVLGMVCVVPYYYFIIFNSNERKLVQSVMKRFRAK